MLKLFEYNPIAYPAWYSQSEPETKPRREPPPTPIVVKHTRADAVYDSWWVATWCGSIATSYDSAEHAVERLRARMSAHAGKVPVLYYTRPRR